MDNYITPEQWRSVRSRCSTQIVTSPPSVLRPADAQDPPLHVREEHDDTVVALKKCFPSLPPSVPPPPPSAISRPTSAGVFRSPHEAPLSVCLNAGPHIDSAINYVNIPISPRLPKTNRELLYSEVDLQESASAPVFSPLRADTESSIRYVYHDTTAMEMAQRVGVEDVQGRLTQLENRWQGNQTERNDWLDDTFHH